jgi:5-methylcytosine-specific restriction endonuclease McrA
VLVKDMATRNRPDHDGAHRGQFEKNKKRIYATQTVCGICGKPVDFSYKNPHPLAPTVDHIIPVSRGGHPSDISNLQLAHRCCNRQKSDSLLEPRKKEEDDRLIPNDELEQHCNWITYRSA